MEALLAQLAAVAQVGARHRFILHPQQRVMRMLLGLEGQKALLGLMALRQLSLALQAVQALEVFKPMILEANLEPRLLVAI
jgi:hypothetical protein|tara:strand:- start:80 stop:322 length:243 start_codon:yes stop_codon:yes gene_type:complete